MPAITDWDEWRKIQRENMEADIRFGLVMHEWRKAEGERLRAIEARNALTAAQVAWIYEKLGGPTP